jgi:hypothetical protein
VLTLKIPSRDDTMRLVISLLEYMQQPAALVPQLASQRRLRECVCLLWVDERHRLPGRGLPIAAIKIADVAKVSFVATTPG